MEGYLGSQCSPKKSPHGALIKKPATRQYMPVSYPSCISRIQIKQSMVHYQGDARRLCHRSGECLPDPHQGCETYSVHPQV